MGCGALKHHDDGSPSDIKRMWVARGRARRGVGRRLLEELERRAVEHGTRAVRLETNAVPGRGDRASTAAPGTSRSTPFNDEPFADHWFRKTL